MSLLNGTKLNIESYPFVTSVNRYEMLLPLARKCIANEKMFMRFLV